VVYDNGLSQPDAFSTPDMSAEPISGGSIVIHAK
jgi:hypothetical protein